MAPPSARKSPAPDFREAPSQEAAPATTETPNRLGRRDQPTAPVTIDDPFASPDGTPFAHGSDADAGLVDAPLADGWILSGDPKPRMKVNATAPGGAISSGVWCCQPSRFTFIYDVDEFIHLVEGRVTVVAGRHVHHLSPGSTVLFPKGLRTEWTVHEAVRKVFVLANPPKWRRVLRRLTPRR